MCTVYTRMHCIWTVFRLSVFFHVQTDSGHPDMKMSEKQMEEVMKE